jgi:uncharacterized protein (DUF169 family)
MELRELHEMAIELEQWLRLRLHMVALKLLKSNEDLPKETIIPTRDWGHKLSLCQTIARVQRRGETIAMFMEDHWCPEPVIGLGHGDRVPFFLEGHHRYPDSVQTIEAGAAWCRNMPHLEYGRFAGSVCSPAMDCQFVPDVIIMHVNGMMLSQLLNVRNWIDGKDLQTQLSGHAGCVYAVVPPFLNGDCQVAVPCKGDRRYAGAQDDEMLFSLVPAMLPAFIKGSRWLQDHGWSVPHVQDYKEEYDLKLIYKNLAEAVGMNTNQSPQREQVFRQY